MNMEDLSYTRPCSCGTPVAYNVGRCDKCVIKQLQAENEKLKDALTQMDNNALAIRLTFEQALQGKKGSK